MKETEFRILGSTLEEPDTFVDATVEGISNDGVVYFAAVKDKDKRTWSLSQNKIRTATNNNFMVGASKVEAHPLWDRAIQLDEDQDKNTKTEYGADNLEDAQRSLFLAAYFETR